MTCSRDPRIVWLAVLSFALPFTIVFLPAGAAPVTYSYNDYNSTQGFRGWTYWDSLGQPMVWNAANSRWTCVNPVDEWCYWSAQGGHPGADRNIIRRWTAPSDGSVRVAGVTKKDSNVCGGGTDGVEAQVKYHSQQSNWFRTTTIPGPAYDLSQVLATMGCNDTTSHAFDYDQEVYSGDTFSFVIDRRRNYSWDSTTLTPTITFEPTDAIGSLSTYSSATSTTATVAFDGFLKCPNGSTCNYTGTFPPDYYTIQPVVFYLNPQQPVATLNNFALCGPADGPLCLNTAPPRFSRTFTGLIPNSAYRFKVRAYRGGHLYGRTQTITLTTGAIAPPSLSPTVSVTARGQSAEFGASDVVISWQAPAPPLDAPRAMERFELYRQTLGSEATVLAPGSQVSSTGEQLCASLNQAGTPAQHMCLSTTAVGGSCSTNFTSGNAMCGRMDPPVLIGFSRWDRNNVMQEWVNTVDQASPTRRTDLSTGVVTSVTDPGVDRKPTVYRYFLVARYSSMYASPVVKSEVLATVNLPRAATIAGFADTHVHQFANLAHGGSLLDGHSGDSDDGSGTFRATPVDMGGFFANATGLALRSCDAVADGGSGNHDFGGLTNVVLDLSPFGHDKSGIKNLPKWMDRTNSLHQQVYKTALKRAVDGGLRLMVMHGVNVEFVCQAVGRVRGGTPISCDDSTSMDAQITAAYRFQSEIDREACPSATIPAIGLPDTHLSNEAPDTECGWYRIVTNPAAARKVMSRGKLAVVLGLEVDTPFNCGTGIKGPWADASRGTCMIGGGPVGGVIDILDPLDGKSLQHFFDRGVRHVFPIHGINNGLGSAAISGASEKYAPAEAALNGGYFRTGPCLDRGMGVDGPLNFRLSLSPLLSTTLRLPLGLGSLSFTGLTGIPAPPTGYPGGTGSTCNTGGPTGLAFPPPFGLTALGRGAIQEMMKRRMIIDVDHMSELSHADAVAESAKSFNYPLVSGHTNLQRLSTGNSSAPGNNEFALSTPELDDVRASGGQVNLVTLAAFTTSPEADKNGVATHARLGGNAASAQFLPRGSVRNDCSNSTKAWAQEYLAAVDLTRNAPVPKDNSAAGVFGVGFGSDINTISALLQPRFGFSGGGWFGCSPEGGPTTPRNDQQEAQWIANEGGLTGKAVQYDVDMLTGLSTIKGYGGIDTSLAADVSNGFPGFAGPRLRRSRLNEGGYLFTIYGPDKPVDGAPNGQVPTMCLDGGGGHGDNDSPQIGDCGNTRNPGQQWLYDATPSLRIRPLLDPGKNLMVKVAVNSSGEFAVTYADSNVFTDYDHPVAEAIWVMRPNGQLFNSSTGLCLSVQQRGFAPGNRVVAAACTSGMTVRPDQLWARGGEEESFNLTGLSHIGMYPDMIQDLKNIGLTTKDLIPLFQSAEGYLQMWERTGWTKPVEYTKLSSNGSWKFTTATPPAGWQNVAFDDTAWRVVNDDNNVLAPYGASPWQTNVAGFPNPTPARWMPVADGNQTFFFRKAFVTDSTGTPKTVTVSCDNTAAVYFDGVLKVNTGSWDVANSFTFVPSSFGTHVIAVQCSNQGGPGGLLVDVR